jgi:hypothetical protein
MTPVELELAKQLEFQHSLLKLAEVADTNRGITPERGPADELKRMMEKVPVRKPSER